MSRPERVEHGFSWSDSLNWPYRLTPPFSRQSLGRWGEWLALRHVRLLGWDILARNWKTKWGELDLVAFEGNTLVALEVRTRLQKDGIPPEATVGRHKLEQVEALAMDFARRHELWDHPFRIDVIAIETPDGSSFELRHSCG